MTMTKRKTDKKAGKAERRAPYHHGDLREALIAATRRLVMERGAENFTLADACRGFEELRVRAMTVIAEKGPGTLEAIVAMGQAYVAFALNETAVFRLMFGQEPSLKKAEHVAGTGQDCFSHLIEQIALYCQRNRVRGDALEIALRLWTFVHGA